MDRRKFLKIGTLSTGAVLAGALPADAKTETVKTYSTSLQTQGYVKEPARRIPVVDKADVVVVGGGPAGFAAAIAAARQGSDVLVLERQYFLGGLFTGCGVTPIINMYNPVMGGEPVKAVSGICEELCDRLDKVGMISFEKIRPKVDPEAAKYYMEEMLSEAGVRLLYGVQAAEILMSGDRITTVIVEGKSGRVAIKTDYVIDCSGDGDILEWAGEDFNVYKEDIGAMWRIGHAEASPKGSKTCIPGVLTRHTTGERQQDGLDMYNLTRVQTGLRKMMWEDAMELRKNPGCEDLFLMDTPSVVGVRITRVLNSVANVTVEGAAVGKSYDDVIGFTGGDSTLAWNDLKIKSGTRKIWQVPYGALLPKTVSNLWVAGRCFGFERGLTYDAREIGTCLMTGQAAGTAAGIAALRRCGCREVDVPELQNRLREQKVKLDW